MKNMILGTSFSPEQVESICQNPPLNVLKTITENLKIKDIRFGLRWNKIDQNEENLSLSYYKPYLDYLLQNNYPVCLNIGPLKTFRWPEEHLPHYVENYVTKTIETDSEIANRSYTYLEKLLQLLQKEYGKKLENVTFQLDNEAFNPFGHFRLKITEDHVLKTIEILHQYFPENKILLNSAGRTNLKQLVSIIQKFSQRKMYRSQNFIIGFNYYFKIPHTLPFFPVFDPVLISRLFDMNIKTLQKRQQEMGFGLEISEGQFEPWGSQTSPGNSYADFEYLIRKCERIFPSDYPKKMVRLWGTEIFAVKILNHKMTPEHYQIREEIKKINRN